MVRIVLLGRGGAGKSTLRRQLAERLDLPLIELDSSFWRPGPTPTPAAEWEQVQDRLLAGDHWVCDGDLGPYDSALARRLAAADTMVILDFPLWRCAWRALRRGRETREFWRWIVFYRSIILTVFLRWTR